jgi:3-hydroxyacyl-CoA dehydrogenase
MAKIEEIQNVAIVGTGVIGASWAAYYLSRGFSVVATDPAPNAEASLRKYVDEAWKTLSKNGLSPNGSRDRLSFAAKYGSGARQSGLCSGERTRTS